MKKLASMFACATLLIAAVGASAQTASATASPTASQAASPATPGVKAGERFEATRSEPMPKEFVDIGVTEKINTRLPLETVFTNEAGQSVSLGDYFQSGRPVILQLGYMSCPKLCDLVSRGTAETLSQLNLELGKDYDVIYISIDPKEKPDLAAAKKRTYISEYALNKKLDDAGIARAQAGWHLLTGQEDAIRKVADTIGFKYKWVATSADEGQYSHPAVITLVTPAGAVASYLYGVAFDPKLLQKALTDTSQGKTGSVMDQIVLFCFHLGPDGKYTLAATRLMQLGGALTVLCLLSTVGVFQLRSRMSRGLPPRATGLSAVLAGGTAGGTAAGTAVGTAGAPAATAGGMNDVNSQMKTDSQVNTDFQDKTDPKD